ncbi:hypothetical protein UFOVP787_191 [uncultured Caudovirales phage]|uniref:Uncharacterized protein n=1 Tax=uncultured Caudovirales phage TaxID=2100421 RepID=A0A6J5NT53_9CAUD|nr:hypothetical protein UFOVP787_191 [uncultured Caudovirales phage]
MDIKDCVKGNVTFQYYRKGELYYKCQNGLIFPVPVSDTGDASFNNEDKGMLFMRWIRKELENRQSGQG